MARYTIQTPLGSCPRFFSVILHERLALSMSSFPTPPSPHQLQHLLQLVHVCHGGPGKYRHCIRTFITTVMLSSCSLLFILGWVRVRGWVSYWVIVMDGSCTPQIFPSRKLNALAQTIHANMHTDINIIYRSPHPPTHPSWSA